MLLLWILNGLDVLTTRLVIEGGGVEANPLVAPFADSTWQLAAVKVAVLAPFTLLKPPRWSVVTLSVWYALVVGWNTWQLL